MIREEPPTVVSLSVLPSGGGANYLPPVTAMPKWTGSCGRGSRAISRQRQGWAAVHAGQRGVLSLVFVTQPQLTTALCLSNAAWGKGVAPMVHVLSYQVLSLPCRN
jgi:hypothetical protein